MNGVWTYALENISPSLFPQKVFPNCVFFFFRFKMGGAIFYQLGNNFAIFFYLEKQMDEMLMVGGCEFTHLEYS